MRNDPVASGTIERAGQRSPPPGLASAGRTHPTFVEVGTNQPLYIHRDGSNVVNGRYFVNRDPAKTVGHYSSFRRVDLDALRTLYDEAKATPAADLAKRSPLAADADRLPVPRYLIAAAPSSPTPPASAVAATAAAAAGAAPVAEDRVTQVIGALNAEGYWPAPLGNTSHPYRGPGAKEIPAGDFSDTLVGDASDTSPYRDATTVGISTSAYIRNMSVLIRSLQ